MRRFTRFLAVIAGVATLAHPALAQEEVFGRVIPSVQHPADDDLASISSEKCEPLFAPDDSVTAIINLPNSFYLKCEDIEAVGEALRDLLKRPSVSSVEIFYIR